MHHILTRYNVLPGDRIVEPKSNLRFIQHHSIYLGQDYIGTDWIIENKIGFGVRLVTADDYFREVIEISRIERFSGDGQARRQAVQRALREVGKPYSLINYNCQHFANYVQHNEVRSEQLAGGILAGVFVLIFIGLLGR